MHKKILPGLIASIVILIPKYSIADGIQAAYNILIPSGSNEGRLRTIGRFPNPHKGYTVTQLANGEYFVYGAFRQDAIQDGQVILDPAVRANRAANQLAYEDSPIVFEPTKHAWVRYAKPATCFRSYLHRAIALSESKVLITGGLCDKPLVDPNDTPLSKAYSANSLWNQEAHTWESIPALAQGRIFHTATRLNNSGVIIVGGMDDRQHQGNALPVLDSVELFQDSNGSRPATITAMPSLTIARANHAAVLLENGNLLVAGGLNANNELLSSVEIFDPKNSEWRTVAPMHVPRQRYDGILLSDGRLMAIGGTDEHGDGLRSVEIYNPALNVWTEVDPLPVTLRTQSAIRLQNGGVLVVGSNKAKNGESVSYCMRWISALSRWTMACEPFGFGSGAIRDPETFQVFSIPDGGALIFGDQAIMEWSDQPATASERLMPTRTGFSTTVLKGGQVLIAGGKIPDSTATPAAELYDPATNRYFNIESMQQARFAAVPYRGSISTLQLPDGRVVLAGGWVFGANSPKLSVANAPDILDPISGRWGIVKGVWFDRLDRVQANIRDDGMVIFFAAREDEANGVADLHAWIWNPQNGSITNKTVPVTARAGAAIAVLKDGRVLIVGGHRLRYVPEFKCPPAQRNVDAGNAEDDEGDGCTSESPYWEKDEQPLAELWDSRSGHVTEISFPSGLSTQDVQTQLLRNGNVLLMHVKPWAFGSSQTYESPWIFDANNSSFIELPKIDSTTNWPISELSDGTIIAWGGASFSDSDVSLEFAQRLHPGSTQWEQMPHFPQARASVVVLPGDRILALSAADSREPYASEWNIDCSCWDLLHNSFLPVHDPVPLKMPDSQAAVVGRIHDQLLVQVWDSRTDEWAFFSRTLKIGQSNIRSAVLPSGNILNLSSVNGQTPDVMDCNIWHREDGHWSKCAEVLLHRENKHKQLVYMLGNLADGRAAVIDQSESSQVFDETGNRWLTADLEWHREQLRYGESIRQDPPLARIYDKAVNRWIDATELGANFLAESKDTFNLASVLWDPKKHLWTYIARRATLPSNGFLLPDGCVFLGLPFSIYEPITGKVEKLQESLIMENGVFTVLDDGNVLSVSTPESMAEPFYFHRRASCSGFDVLSSDPEYMPPKLIGDGVIVHGEVSTSPTESPRPHSMNYFSSIEKSLKDFVSSYRTKSILIVISLGLGFILLVISAKYFGVARRKYIILLSIVLVYAIARTVHDIWFQGDDIDGPAETISYALQPCEFTGVWEITSRDSGLVRIALHGDGRFERVDGLVGQRWDHNEGHWRVDDNTFVWVGRGFEASPELDPILTINESSFSLRGSKGFPVRYGLISRLKGEHCKK